MIVRPSANSWQTILADLSLILFMVTASALANAPDGHSATPVHPAPAHPAPPPEPVRASLRAEPVGVWTDGPGAPPLARWLADQAGDPRQRLSIVVRYRPGDRVAALERAARLAAAAGTRGENGRVVIEPGAVSGASATLGYDEERAGLAR
jgi:hypothetical protein